MRKDENGDECPSTLGEYRDLCLAIGGQDCPAVKFLDKKISASGRDDIVLVSDSQMRVILLPLLIPPGFIATKEPF